MSKIKLLVFTTVFGALWGLLEMYAGSYLHAMQFPFRGAIMAGLAGIILCAERGYTPVFGASLYTGLIALVIKAFSIGGVKLGPMAGIAIEAVLAEAVLSICGMKKYSVFLACLLCCLEAIPHFFVTNFLFFGRGIFDTYMAAIKQIQTFFHLPENVWAQIFAIWLGGHIVIGLITGFTGLKVAQYLRKV